MAIEQILALLVSERDRLNLAIEALQGPVKRRGRPPKNPLIGTESSAAPTAPKKRRRTFTAAQRAQQAERMRQYWAKKRKK